MNSAAVGTGSDVTCGLQRAPATNKTSNLAGTAGRHRPAPHARAGTRASGRKKSRLGAQTRIGGTALYREVRA